MLEREAEKQGLSFCSYLEQLILERHNDLKSNAILDENKIIETFNNNTLSEVDEEEKTVLKSQIDRLKQTYVDYQKRSIFEEQSVYGEFYS